MRKSLGHFLNRELSRGWTAWHEMAVERAAFMQKLRHGLGHMMNRKLSSGLAGWRARDRSARRPNVEGAAAALPEPRAVAVAGSAWQELMATRAAMRRGLAHMLNRGLSRGWGAWHEMAVERSAFMQKLRKGLSRMVNRKLALSYAGWREAIAPLDDHMSKALLHF